MQNTDTRHSIRIVTSNNFLRASGLENTSLQARKLLYLAMAQSRQNDKSFFEYSISIKDFSNFMGVDSSNVYQTADKITDELMAGFIKYIPQGKKRFRKFQLFKVCEYIEGKGIRFELSEDMTPIMLNLRGDFTQALLDDFAKMKSTYSIAIWHLMQREMKSKKPYASKIIKFELSIDELRKITGTTEKFKQIGQFKEKVFEKALREIDQNCGVKITYENVKSGRTITGFQCSAVSQYHIPESEIPSKAKNRSRLGELRIKSKQRELTLEEQKEYDILTAKCEQMQLEF